MSDFKASVPKLQPVGGSQDIANCRIPYIIWYVSLWCFQKIHLKQKTRLSPKGCCSAGGWRRKEKPAGISRLQKKYLKRISIKYKSRLVSSIFYTQQYKAIISFSQKHPVIAVNQNNLTRSINSFIMLFSMLVILAGLMVSPSIASPIASNQPADFLNVSSSLNRSNCC